MCEVISTLLVSVLLQYRELQGLGDWSVRRRVAGWLVRNRAEVMLFFVQPLLVVLGARPSPAQLMRVWTEAWGLSPGRTAAVLWSHSRGSLEATGAKAG